MTGFSPTENVLITTVVASGQVRKIDDTPKPWGKEHPKRGLEYSDLAVALREMFPVGSQLSQTAFCEWATKTLHSERFYDWALQHDAFVNTPKDGTDKSADAWHAHLSRRHRLRFNINKAATHSRMNHDAFKLVSVGPNKLEMQRVEVALVSSNFEKREKTRLESKRREYGYLMQSTDWARLDTRTQIQIEKVWEGIGYYIEDTERAAYRLDHECGKADDALKAIGIGIPKELSAPEADDAIDENEQTDD